MKKAIILIAIILLLGVFAFSAWKVVDISLEYRAGEAFYEGLDQYVSIPQTTQKKPLLWEKEDAPEETFPEDSAGLVWPQVDFAALQQINPDVVGWICIPGTNVNYPILQGKNNDQYLYHLMTGAYNSAGSIFLDAGVSPDFSQPNSPVYGHNMKNGTMFADVTGYKSQEFYDAHPYALLLTPEKNYYVRVFSGYVVSERGDAWKTEFNAGQFESWLESVGGKSCFAPENAHPTAQDRILTLSTCTYETDGVRFVVHGVLEEYANTAG